MEVMAAFGSLFLVLFLIFMAILSFFAPYFLWRIHCNVKAIKEMIERDLADRGIKIEDEGPLPKEKKGSWLNR